ncbi:MULTISPECIES: DUF742 domain-containing protein [unclassified Streptomyces]|uniref:DUF742 domain-containing protein n=1 Tax=Streptomyces evansiae TaxID=3075535 RepID=A0ABD5EAK7_9ACTN|nr:MULTISPECIES: DUF742 domain-containing protein [unclassified Streptomyces]EFL03845.1 CvhC [Streptomyces sp. SPB78]MYQ59834.1 DUF742 domain-containing protein [Streptomyces sp. SID4926]MYR29614.1 DUF742 domain-containing protein [Streptomyces sp. SID4945]ASY31745.1 hypothetical protein CAC01_02770 [Streptomyces sp. CLI2509]MDT0410891.1 DUF742 domain-containing protein [Streptomyces sp. DSM 41979]
MTPRGPADVGEPDRIFLVTGGRTAAGSRVFDLVTLVVRETDRARDLGPEHQRVLDLCQHPVAVVELSAELGLPVVVTRILLEDLLAAGHIRVRSPRPAARAAGTTGPDTAVLEEVLHALRRL